MKSTTAFRIAAVAGFLGVALGAFGAHGLHDLLEKNNTIDIWKTASQYHLIHAALLLFLATLRPMPRLPWVLFLCGVVIFSGSLYLLAVTGIRWLGAITPLGGLSLLAGWLLLAVKPFAAKEP
jgi:uncharacterized membrane protein YgdD (TMEM256/DUF423 family)